MHCEIVTQFERLEEFAPMWQMWAESDPRTEFFQCWSWASAFWTAYGGSMSLFTPVVHQGNKPIGILPLVCSGRTLQFLGAPDSDYNDILCQEDDAEEVLEAALSELLSQSGNWKACVLDNLPAESKIARHWQELPPRIRRHLQLAFRYPSPTLMFDKQQRELGDLVRVRKKDQKKLERFGSVVFRHIESQSEAQQHLTEFFDQHVTRFALKGTESQFRSDNQRRFYEALVQRLDPRRQLRFSVLEVGGKPIAYHFGFQWNRRITYYKLAFDVAFWDCSPGDVLLKFLLQHATTAEVSEFDFSIGDEGYKQRYANHTKQNCVLYVDRHPASLSTLGRRIATRLQDSVRKHLRARNTARKFLYFLRRPNLFASYVSGLLENFQKALWARDEVFFFCSSARRAGEAPGPELVAASLRDIARLALEHPEYLNEARLEQYRGRLRQGDRLLLARPQGNHIAIFWSGVRNEIRIPELGPDCVLPLDAPAFVIYETWISPGFPTGRVLSEILSSVPKHLTDMDVWMYCSQSEVYRGAFHATDIQLRYCLTHFSLTPWFHRTSIRSAVNGLMNLTKVERGAVLGGHP